MKKFRTIISALAAAAVITTIPAQAAIEMYNPIRKIFMPNNIVNGMGDFMYRDLYSGATVTNGEKSDEDGNVIVDSYDGENYWYAKRDMDSGKLNVITTCGTGYSITTGNNPDEISRYATVYGKVHNDIILRYSDPDSIETVNGTDAKGNSYLLNEGYTMCGFDTDGKVIGFTIKPYWVDEHGYLFFNYAGPVNKDDNYLGRCQFGDWLKLSIEADVPNDTVVFTMENLTTNTTTQVSRKLSDCGAKITNIICGTRFRSTNKVWGLSVSKITTIRDTFVVNDLSVTDTEKVVASAKMANHGSKVNNYFMIIDEKGNEAYMGDNFKTNVEALCKKTPMLILAQYDAEGRLIACSFNKPEKLESDFGPGQFYINPKHVVKENETKETETVNWQDVKIELDKASGYSYAKAYVWTGLDSQKPYLESVSTQVTQ